MEPNFPQHLILENDAVLIRPLSLDDFDELLPFSLNEPELWTYSLVSAGGSENLQKYMEKALHDKQTGRSFPLLVIDKTTGEIAGSTRYYEYDSFHQTVLLGYTWYGKKFQGTGLNKQCKFLLLEYAFDQLKVERVEFRADSNNQRSIAAMKSIGCTVEGILRSNCKSEDGRRDSIVLSILRSEWESEVRSSLAAKMAK